MARNTKTRTKAWLVEHRKKTMELIWALILSVCTTDRCITQTVLETDEQDMCIVEKVLHEQLPQDGDWKTVEYKCKLLNTVQI